MNAKDRIQALRKVMKEKKIDVVYIPNEDDHLSAEYTAPRYQCKSYISGFSGEAGCTVVTQKKALLWTDGRYFTQAEIELEGSEVELMRMRQAGVPTVQEWLIANTPKNGTLAFDGNVVSALEAKKLADALKAKNAKLHIEEDLVGKVWTDRPEMPDAPIYVLPKKYTGESAEERIEKVRIEMAKKGADVLIITALEDPCWMLNVRGDDIACTPVAYAFAVVEKKKCTYYIDLNKVPAKVKEYLKKAGVTVKAYDVLAKDLSKYSKKIIWADLGSLNANLYNALVGHGNQIIHATSPIEDFRAIKTETEQNCTRNAHMKDGVAMTKFMYWLKQNAGKPMTEVSAQNVLYDLRAEQKDYIEPSFHTISAYGPNGAMMHYTATEDSYSAIKGKGFLLVDSGGTYKDGTTDITRTFAMGKLTTQEKKYYTLVLKGHIDLAKAKFLEGTTGQNLDILARRPLWDLNIDYQCGTGHGVGHVLGVHEGPHGIRWGLRTTTGRIAPLVPGMIVTDEPGVYLPHKLGVRIENELLVVKGENNFYGQFLEFENLTHCPYDLDAIEPKYLDNEEIAWLNNYHKETYNLIAPKLNAKEKAWLKKATKPIKK